MDGDRQQPSVTLPEAWEDLERQIAFCAFCPKMCRFACPTALVRPSESLHPTGKARLMLRLLKDGMPLTKEMAEVFYRCTGCLLSHSYCDHEIQVYPPLERVRARVLAAGQEPTGVRKTLESLRSWGNPFHEDLPAVFHERVPGHWNAPEAQVLVFSGCNTLAHNPRVLGDLIHLLEVLGIDVVGFMPPEPLCCGGIHLDLGDEAGFRETAARLYERLSGAKKILTLCPHCLHTLKVRYAWLDQAFGNRVEHVSSYLLDLFPRDVKRSPSPLVYHDPCYMGRYLGQYDPPRKLLQRILPDGGLQEFSKSRQWAECCGGGGGLPLIFAKDAQAIARLRLSVLTDKDLPVVTCCPLCIQLFREAHPEREALDLVTALARALDPQSITHED